MRFKIDENAPFSVRVILESKGNHEINSVYDEGISGIVDKDLLDLCLKEKRILITLDNDFSNAVLHPRDSFYGIILLRPETQGKKAFIKLFQEFVSQYEITNVINKVIIVEPNKIIVRWDCIE